MKTLTDLIEQLIHVGEDAVHQGLVLASSGNLSARLPESNKFVITGSGTWLHRLTPEDFAVVDMSGSTSSTVSARPSSEWKLHQRTYEARPDVNAIIHLHPEYTLLLDALGIRVNLPFMDHAFYVGSVGRTGYRHNGSDALANEAAQVALSHDCVILERHGSSTMGTDIEMAFRRALNLEQAARTTYRAALLGSQNLDFPDHFRDGLSHA